MDVCGLVRASYLSHLSPQLPDILVPCGGWVCDLHRAVVPFGLLEFIETSVLSRHRAGADWVAKQPTVFYLTQGTAAQPLERPKNKTSFISWAQIYNFRRGGGELNVDSLHYDSRSPSSESAARTRNFVSIYS